MKSKIVFSFFVFLFVMSSYTTYADAIDFHLEKKIVLDENNIPLSRVGHVVFDKNMNIYLYDYNPPAIYKYNSKGKYLKTIAKRGNGPSEIRYIQKIDIDSNSSKLFMVDDWKTALLIFDLEGTFVQSVRLQNLPQRTFVNSFGDIYIDHRREKGECRITRLDKDFKNKECFFIESGRGHFKSFEFDPFTMCFDPQGNVFAAIGIDYKIFVFNRYGKLLRTFGQPGDDFSTLKREPPLPMGGKRFKKWQDSFCIVYGMKIINKKYCVVFYKRAFKRGGIISYDIYTLEGKKLANGKLPRGIRPVGEDGEGNLYCSKVDISDDGGDITHWLYKYSIKPVKKNEK